MREENIVRMVYCLVVCVLTVEGTFTSRVHLLSNRVLGNNLVVVHTAGGVHILGVRFIVPRGTAASLKEGHC